MCSASSQSPPIQDPGESARSLGASREAIAHHYDVSNDFYRLWLDQATTSYTCALYGDETEEESLDLAQERKLAYHANQARVDNAARVLDIGCGWGNLLEHLVNRRGVECAVGLTLSASQAEHIRSKGNPRLQVLTESWTAHAPTEPYDAIVSIEAIEAFAKPNLSETQKIEIYRSLFARCHQWLRPGGIMSWQMICYGNSGPEDLDEFIATEIFPESDLPRLAEISTAIERRFELVSLRNDRAHYVRTLRAWLKRLKANRGRAVELVGEPTVKRYEYYLRLSIFMFQTGTCDLHRMTLRRIDQPRPRRQARRQYC